MLQNVLNVLINLISKHENVLIDKIQEIDFINSKLDMQHSSSVDFETYKNMNEDEIKEYKSQKTIKNVQRFDIDAIKDDLKEALVE